MQIEACSDIDTVMSKRREILLGALKDADSQVKKAAAEALESLQARERVDALEKKIETGEMLEKIRVIYALSDLRGPRVAEALAKSLKDPVEDVPYLLLFHVGHAVQREKGRHQVDAE